MSAPDDVRRAVAELPRLDAGYRDCIRAYAPPNPQFERERIIARAAAPREWAFVLGLLSEGENEAGLLLELIGATIAAEPDAPVAHLVDEAWYYLRTSIDPAWQLDTAPPSATAALRYLVAVLDERRRALLALPPVEAVAERPVAGRAAMLRALRDAASVEEGVTPEPAR